MILVGACPKGGSYYIDNVLADLLLSSQNISPGFYEVVYVFEDQSASQEIYIVSPPEINLIPSNESVTVSFDPVMNVDQYKFRYRETGTSVWDEVTIGAIDGVETLASFVTITNLIGCTDYEIQTKLYSTDLCETDWSSSTVFSLDYFSQQVFLDAIRYSLKESINMKAVFTPMNTKGSINVIVL